MLGQPFRHRRIPTPGSDVFDTLFGLPFHPLVVHATVVAVPLAAGLVAGAALWPRLRRWAGPLPLGVSAAALVLDPLSTASGESLQHRVGQSDLVARHAHLADQLLPWLVGLTVAAAALAWVWFRERPSSGEASGQASGEGRPGRALLVSVAVLAVVTAAGTSVAVARIGHSGAEAAWSGVARSDPHGGG
jgi:hypothetical protein